VCLLMAAVGLCAQDALLDRVVKEAAAVRKIAEPTRETNRAFKAALRDWIEAQLPQSLTELDARFSLLETKLTADLWRAGLTDVASEGLGTVESVSLTRPAEYPRGLAVTARVGVPCGHDDTLYVYDYSQGTPRRVLEFDGKRERDEMIWGVEVSKAGPDGSRLIASLRYAATCASIWNGMAYDVFRLTAEPERAVPVLSGDQGFWLDQDDPVVRLRSDEFLLELIYANIALAPRAHVLRYRVGSEGAERIDPVALQPQDFVDEWLTRPWEEMASRSDPSNPKLKKWHGLMQPGYVHGEMKLVQPCAEPPQHWQIAVDVSQIGDRESPDPLSMYFLVRQFEEHRYEVVDVSYQRQAGCPGETPPNTLTPSLFKKADQK
jgi:hypothetical protein